MRTRFSLVVLAVAGLAWPCAAQEGAPAFFSQWTVASHTDGGQHNWPNIACLEDERILLVWSCLKDGEYTIAGAISRDAGCSWTTPQTLIDNPGLTDADPSIVVSGNRVFVTCTAVKSGGINTSTTWCVRSENNGNTWSEPYTIPTNHRYTCGKTHRGLRLRSGTLLMGYSWDVILEKGDTLHEEGQMDLRAGVMRSTDNGDTWTNAGDTHATFEKVSGGAVSGTDEPAIAELDDGSVYMLMRTGADHLYEARSTDEGLTWEGVQPSPLRGSNAPAALSRFDADGRSGIFVVWDNAIQRFPLCAAASFDGARTWSPPKDIGFPYTGGQASYPSCVQAPDGTLLAVWQHDVPGGRDVRLARFNPAWLLSDDQPALEKAADDIRIPPASEPAAGYAGGQDPGQAAPAWRKHNAGGTVTESGTLVLAPTGGYYIDNVPSAWSGESDVRVESTMRVVTRESDAPANHSAAELWIGGPEPSTSCIVFFRENAVALNESYSPSYTIDATAFHMYRVLVDHRRRQAYLFVDDGDAPVLTARLTAPYGHNINRILFGDSGGAKDVSGTSEWKSILWTPVQLPEPGAPPVPSATIVCFGDSTTAPRGPLSVFAGLLREDLAARGTHVEVVNAGVGGDTTNMALKRFEQDVLAHQPDVVAIGFGINDSAVDVAKGATEPRVSPEQYEANLRYLVRTLRNQDATPILMTPNPLAWTPLLKEMYGKPPYNPEDAGGFSVLLRDYAETVRRIAKEEDVPLVDTYRMFETRGLEGLLLDGMHPNDVGHRLIADALLPVIMDLLADGAERGAGPSLQETGQP